MSRPREAPSRSSTRLRKPLWRPFPSERVAGTSRSRPDGSRAYVASGLVYVIDTATNTVVTLVRGRSGTHPRRRRTTRRPSRFRRTGLEPTSASFFHRRWTVRVQRERQHRPRGHGVGVGQPARSSSVSVPGSIALTPDGSRAYVGIQSTFVNTGYGSGFLPGTSRRRGRHDHEYHRGDHRLSAPMAQRDAAEHPRRYRRDAGSTCRLRRRSPARAPSPWPT